MNTLLINDRNGVKYLINTDTIIYMCGIYKANGKELNTTIIKLINGDRFEAEEYFSELVKILHN